MKKTSGVLLVGAVIVLVVAGYYMYTRQAQAPGTVSENGEVMSYPVPPEVVNNSGGTVMGIYGALLAVEMSDIGDYLPHADGTPQRMVNIGLNVTDTTKLTLVSLESGGEEKAIKVSDINAGDAVRFWSDANIRGATQVDATIIQVIR